MGANSAKNSGLPNHQSVILRICREWGNCPPPSFDRYLPKCASPASDMLRAVRKDGPLAIRTTGESLRGRFGLVRREYSRRLLSRCVGKFFDACPCGGNQVLECKLLLGCDVAGL